MTMTEQPTSLLVESDQPLIGIVLEENGHEVIRYFADEAAADAVTADAGTQAALGAIGAWSDLDWEEIETELDRIRHASRPTPPITDL
jgi:hypothetical protein